MVEKRHVLVVGGFDGVHRGHQRLFAEARRIANQIDGEVTALSFRTSPLTRLRPDEVPPVIQRLDQRVAALLDAGADEVEWLDPTEELLSQSADAFIEGVWERYHPVAFVEGVNFRFGKARGGDVQQLTAMGQRLGFSVKIVDLIHIPLRDKTIAPLSSSLIRWLITEGRVADVGLCLGRPFALLGEVIHGEQRGRTLGYPTINLDVREQMLPTDGVYAGRILVEDHAWPAAISIGVKPTFAGIQRVCEAHLLGFQGDLYGRLIEVALHRWIRDQQRFPTIDHLKSQLDRDMAIIRELDRCGQLDPIVHVTNPTAEVPV